MQAAVGRIIVPICNHSAQDGGCILQSESVDGGRTVSQPRNTGLLGLPAHLLAVGDGRLLTTYGYRHEPYGVRASLSEDGGRTWSEPLVLDEIQGARDLGYPATVELDGGNLLSVWYEKLPGRHLKHPESVVGTYANRMIHSDTDQLVMGPHLVNADGSVRTVEELASHRLTATMEHLEDPGRRVYMLTMEGLLFELDVKDLTVRHVADLVKELSLPPGAKPHFKGGHASDGQLVVANNTYDEPEFWASVVRDVWRPGTAASGRSWRRPLSWT